MRCRTCNYPLWNLPARECPECGASFKPSEYEFVPRTVQFCCPHCDQAYFGTDERGQPQPRMFQCVNCDVLIDIDQTVLRPLEGHDERKTQADRMPWIEREGSVIGAWFATMKWAMIDPGRLIRATPLDTGIGRALLFALVTTAIFLIVGQVLPSLLYSMLMSVRTGGFMGWTATYYALGGIGAFAGGIVGIVAYLLVWALVAHGVLRITGETPGGLRRTCHSIFYSAGSGVLIALPCCGFFIGLVWWVVSASQMVKVAQKAHGGRAALAVLIWPLLSMIALPVIWYVTIMFMLVGAMAGGGFVGPAGVGGMTAGQQATLTINQAILAHASQNGGAAPEHAIEVSFTNSWVLGQWAGSFNFCDASTQTTPADIPIGTTTLDQFLTMTTSQRLGAAKSALDGLPANVVAHRVGDFVFVYHGANVAWDPQLWTVIMAPDPDANPAPQASDPIYIGDGGYNATTTTYGQFPGLLKTQNQYRASLGLPPLPDPFTVTHAKPASSSSSNGPEEPDGEDE